LRPHSSADELLIAHLVVIEKHVNSLGR